MKNHIAVLLFFIAACSCKAPSTLKSTDGETNIDTSANKKYAFKKITFFSTRCFGSCPAVKMNIFPDGKLELARASTVGKGAPDKANSGNFTMQLSAQRYRELIQLFQKVNWDTITFKKEFCCDAPIRTLILSYDGKQKQFRSMFPPEETAAIFDRLMELVISPDLKRYSREFVFEKQPEE